MKNLCLRRLSFLWLALIIANISLLHAIEPGDVIINEVFFGAKTGQKRFDAVELLVVADKVNLNGLQISDRDIWNKATEDQCTLQDMGQAFLSEVPSGTLLVIYNGIGKDDTDPSDSVLSFFAKSSLFCNIAPTTNAFRLQNQGDNIHLLHFGKQIDFVKYRASDATLRDAAQPGTLSWNNGIDGNVDAGPSGENLGIKFLGNKTELNDYPAAWQAYPESYKITKNLGQPNGGANTIWINELRAKSSVNRNAIVRAE